MDRMQIVMDTDEANSLMSLITSYVIDRAGLSHEGKQAVHKWRTGRAIGSTAMANLAVAMNQALGAFIEERADRQVRRKGRYARARDVIQ